MDNNLSRAPRVKFLNNRKDTVCTKRTVLKHTKECLDHFMILIRVRKTNGKEVLDCFITHNE